jgi:hypothetical protein
MFSTYFLVAIIRKELRLAQSLYTILQVLSKKEKEWNQGRRGR